MESTDIQPTKTEEDVQALAARLMTSGQSTRQDYLRALHALDIAVCEAMAVGQAQAGRQAGACLGYASYLFARMCAYGTAAVRAAPLSRWVKSDHEDWGFSVLACHARSLLEGHLYFHYFLSPANAQLDEERARVTLLQLNDCCSRLKMFASNAVERAGFEGHRVELTNRLKSIPYFQQLPPQVQAQCLAGKKAWFPDRAQLVQAVGMEKAGFDIIWDLWSQHSHVHPMSFFRTEPNGRGTGIENGADRSYLAVAMLLSADILTAATDKLVEAFPDTAQVRRGIDSKFSPGPKRNRRR